jgi:hypothetical protein
MFKTDINLAYNTNLRTIELNGDHPSDMNWMATMLSRITSPHMEHVCLSFNMNAVADLDGVGWSSIEHLLTRPGWASLQQLKIGLSAASHLMPEVRETIKHHLPILDSRGVVLLYRSGRFESP